MSKQQKRTQNWTQNRRAHRLQAGMHSVSRGVYTLLLAALLSLVLLPRAAADGKNTAKEKSVARGEYLTTILGCGGCHTEGALEGLPYGDPLAGSKIGIAYSEYSRLEDAIPPAIVFPSNLTSHKENGLGRWNRRQIARAIRSGINHVGGEVITVMPWINYSLLHRQDINDIVSYLRSLPAVDYAIPDPLTVGESASHPYLRIGVYQFTPSSNTTSEDNRQQ